MKNKTMHYYHHLLDLTFHGRPADGVFWAIGFVGLRRHVSTEDHGVSAQLQIMGPYTDPIRARVISLSFGDDHNWAYTTVMTCEYKDLRLAEVTAKCRLEVAREALDRSIEYYNGGQYTLEENTPSDSPKEDSWIERTCHTPDKVEGRRREYSYHFQHSSKSVPDCTCASCQDAYRCRFCFDPYNTNGACLAAK